MIHLTIKSQPNDETCGPTSLHAIYHYYGFPISLADVINSTERSLSGGTLISLLGKHALMHGFDATIFVNNMNLFDPTWFNKTRSNGEALISKLKAQDKAKFNKNLTVASKAFQGFISLGGEVRFKTIDAKMLRDYFKQNIPILSGLSSTYLYRSARELFTSTGESYPDDVRGFNCGHFVVLCGYDDTKRRIVVADPFKENPFSEGNIYKVSISRLINAIMLGALTYDAGLLIITPKKKI